MEPELSLADLKKRLYESIKNERLVESSLELFFIQDEQPIQKEDEYWDYKKEVEESSLDYGRTIRSICSMHNSYGGFIVYGVEEIEKDKVFVATGISGSLDVQKLKGSMDKLLNRRIDFQYIEITKLIGAVEKRFALILVPQRPVGAPSVATIKDCGDARKQVFRQDSTFIRVLDECVPATLDEHFRFLNSARDPYREQRASARKIIPHNLPDKNFICQDFVGREAIIQALWAWVSDDFDYVKVLAGEGGKGKTSIAYEFARLLAKSEPDNFDQIVWLTAKLKQFKADAGRYVSTPETHYSDLDTLLYKICSETGSLEEELDDKPAQVLKRIAKANLEAVPSFLVIDDVDSTSPEEQKRILETARSIANQNSKILLTTRSNTTYSSEIAIAVPGLSGQDYDDLLSSLAERLGTQVPSRKQAAALSETSNGSPLFTESIFRLAKLGVPLDRAMSDWRGKAGEEVRSAALQREIEQLSNIGKRVLLAATTVGTCSLAELADITETEKNTILNAIEELNSLFLIQSPAIISQEPRFEVSDTTSRLVLSISERLVPNHQAFIAKVRNHATSLNLARSGTSRKGVGAAISQANALLKSQDYEGARKTISSTLKKPQFKDNPDLLLMLGRIEHSDPHRLQSNAISLFHEAYRRGQKKDILFALWYEALEQNGTNQERIEVACFALENNADNISNWMSILAQQYFEKIDRTSNPASKIKVILEAWENLRKFARRSLGGAVKGEEVNESLIDLLYQQASVSHGYDLLIAEAIVHAIRKGDVRTVNFERYGALLAKLTKITLQREEEKIRKLVADVDRCIRDLRNPTLKAVIGRLQEQIVKKLEFAE